MEATTNLSIKRKKPKPIARIVGRGILGKYFNVPWPIWIDLRVTYRCNLRCSYCDLPDQKMPEMDMEELKRVIDKMNAKGRVILLTGGEPLMREDIGQIVDHIVFHSDMEVVFNTNLLFLKRKYEEVKNADGFYFSLDGTKETHEKNKGRGSWKGVEEGLEILHRDRRGKISMTVVTANTTLDDIRFVLDTCEKFEILPAFQLVRHYEHSRGSKEIAPDMGNAIRIFAYLLERRRAGFTMMNSTKGLQRQILLAKGSLEARCYSGKLLATVDADGMMGLCFSRPRNDVFLNLRDPNVSWNDALRALAKIKPHTKRCPTCTCMAPIEFSLAGLLNPDVLWDNYVSQKKFDKLEMAYGARR